MINNLFQSNAINFNINTLNSSKELPINIKHSKKFIQIMKSIKMLGLIEPVIIYIDDKTNKIKIVDGHLRVEALKNLGETEVKCLISTIYDTYTPNNKVNRITIIEEQKMIQKAIKKGVSLENLSEALDISIESVKDKIKILNHICPEVITLLANQHVPKSTLYTLKKMKPIRQIECANLMLTLDNFSEKFSLSLLNGTPPSLLNVTKEQKKREKEGHRAAISRLEREMSQTQVEAEKLKESYGVNSLKLVIIKSNIKKILSNTNILHWFIDNQKDYLIELKNISNINNLSPD